MPSTATLLTGGISGAGVVSMLFAGLPSLVAMILNYVTRSEVRGTWLASHLRWQLRTFWFALLWGLFSFVFGVLFVLATLGTGGMIVVGAWLLPIVLGLWFIYRIARGWLALRAHRPMYTSAA